MSVTCNYNGCQEICQDEEHRIVHILEVHTQVCPICQCICSNEDGDFDAHMKGFHPTRWELLIFRIKKMLGYQEKKS